jgi:hypothetical protein
MDEAKSISIHINMNDALLMVSKTRELFIIIVGGVADQSRNNER